MCFFRLWRDRLQNNAKLKYCVMSRKRSRAYLQSCLIQRAKGLHDGLDEASISSLPCSCIKAFFFVSASHAAGSVEYNFTGSEGSHHVICSSISVAIRNKLMLCTGGPKDYSHSQQVLTHQCGRKKAMFPVTSWILLRFYNSRMSVCTYTVNVCKLYKHL